MASPIKINLSETGFDETDDINDEKEKGNENEKKQKDAKQKDKPDKINSSNPFEQHDGKRIERSHIYPMTFEEWLSQNKNRVTNKKRVLIPLSPQSSQIDMVDVHNRNITKVSLENWQGRTPRDLGKRWLVET